MRVRYLRSYCSIYHVQAASTCIEWVHHVPSVGEKDVDEVVFGVNPEQSARCATVPEGALGGREVAIGREGRLAPSQGVVKGVARAKLLCAPRVVLGHQANR